MSMWKVNMSAVTLDESGRIQLPQTVQEQLGLAVKTVLRLEVEDGKIILTPMINEPKVYYKKGLLVVESETTVNELDLVDSLREERIQEQLS
jgi:bifunctional DNA-binding transcriptional regulator/antitoxin component of YhaV-PrlF toxin-antitoxin module